jgi:hypothetical protein
VPVFAGCIDGKHCMTFKPKKSGAQHYNYKHNFSTVLMAVCDASYRFRYVDVGSYGHNSDGGVFDSCDLLKAIKQGVLHLPKARKLPGSKVESPYFFVGDGAFPLSEFMMKPFAGLNLSDERRIFNYRYSCSVAIVQISTNFEVFKFFKRLFFLIFRFYILLSRINFLKVVIWFCQRLSF